MPMQHFHRTIKGWNAFAQFYVDAVKAAPARGAHFVEIGSYYGRSAAFMGVEIANSGKIIFFDCIDPWTDGGPDLRHKGLKDIYPGFIKNVAPVLRLIRPIRLPSLEAVELYRDDSLDFVLIDGSHQYVDVKADILAWLPKMKVGSVLAGDDYGWPGVKQACDEIFNFECGDGPKGKTVPRACWRVLITANGPEPYRPAN